MHNVLLVDDDTDLLQLLKRSLTLHGFNVAISAEPSRVREMIDLIQPVVVILDINMGDYDGREICKELKSVEAYRHIPVILYSALVDASSSLETCKADIFLQKPLTAQILANHLHALRIA